ncbi:MAG: hypothetical protein PUF50_00630 [Erysipelotrichaceae bacterium]|nr:hypothetical protein [Erysipelotrichaceae bacterium]
MKDKMQEFLDEMTWEIAELCAMYDKWAAEEEKEEFERLRIEYEQYKVNKIKFNADLEKFRV